jgi:hypothetical protein
MSTIKISDRPSYSSIPETKIVASFKRFVNEKQKNLSMSSSETTLSNILPPNVKDENEMPSDESSITYQSQIISCYYTIDDQKQEQFWKDNEQELQRASRMDANSFYYFVLTKIAEYFGITRESEKLKKYLLDKVVYAYNDRGERIYIQEILRFDNSQHVGLGFQSTSSPEMCKSKRESDEETTMWVVKWNIEPESGEEMTFQAFKKWRQVSNTGANVPKIYTDFYILDFPVIVVEQLTPLDASDYNQKLVMSIVSYIEKIIPIGVNNNIKPSNIMKRINKDSSITYIVTDVEMMTTEEKAYGYKRYSWSPEWTSQVVDINTITTVKNDLLEFGYTLNYLAQMQDAQAELDLAQQIRIIEMPEELNDWMERVRIIDEQNIKLVDFIELKKMSQSFPKPEEKVGQNKIQSTYDQ